MNLRKNVTDSFMAATHFTVYALYSKDALLNNNADIMQKWAENLLLET